MQLEDLLKRLINWFLLKHPSRLEGFERERIVGDHVTLIRYRRQTARAYRTWRAEYKGLSYDIIFGFDYLGYLPDIPLDHKKDRLSTHLCTIYRQGWHSKFDSDRGVNLPDIKMLFSSEVNLEPTMPVLALAKWRRLTSHEKQPIQTLHDLQNRMIDEIAKYALRHPPHLIEPDSINWKEVVYQTVGVFLGKGSQVFPRTDN